MFEDICRRYGDVMDVMEETRKKTFLEYWQVCDSCVKVESHQQINKVIILQICGSRYSVEAREEQEKPVSSWVEDFMQARRNRIKKD